MSGENEIANFLAVPEFALATFIIAIALILGFAVVAWQKIRR